MLFNTLHHRAIPFRRSARRSYPMPALFTSLLCRGCAIQFLCYATLYRCHAATRSPMPMPDSAMPVYAIALLLFAIPLRFFAYLCYANAALTLLYLCVTLHRKAITSLHPASPCGTIPLLFSAYQFSTQPIHCQRCWTQLRRCFTLQTQPCFSFAVRCFASACRCLSLLYRALLCHCIAQHCIRCHRLSMLNGAIPLLYISKVSYSVAYNALPPIISPPAPISSHTNRPFPLFLHWPSPLYLP